MPSRLFYILLLCVLVTSVPAFADIVFTDSTFNISTDYLQTLLNADANVTASYLQCSDCGNLGQALQVQVSTPASPGGNAYIGFLNNNFIYNPSVQGAIISIDASVDKNIILDRPATYFNNTFEPLIEQGGNYYVAIITTNSFSGTTTGYQTLGQTGLVATDFSLFDFGTASTPNFSVNPDFTASGAPLTLGLAPLVSANDMFNITVNYDNLNFDIIPDTQGGITQSPVPESSSVGLLSIFLMGLVLRGLRPAIRWKLKRQ